MTLNASDISEGYNHKDIKKREYQTPFLKR